MYHKFHVRMTHASYQVHLDPYGDAAQYLQGSNEWFHETSALLVHLHLHVMHIFAAILVITVKPVCRIYIIFSA